MVSIYRDGLTGMSQTQIAAQYASSTAQAALQRAEGAVRDVDRVHGTIQDLKTRIEALEAEITQLKQGR